MAKCKALINGIGGEKVNIIIYLLLVQLVLLPYKPNCTMRKFVRIYRHLWIRLTEENDPVPLRS